MYLLSPAAQSDLSDIWDYSAKQWSLARADEYILAIRDACGALVDGSRQGRSIEDIRAGYLKLAVQSHFIFYRQGDDGTVHIVRILHQRMDAPARLSD